MNSDIKISVDEYEVYDSGVVISHENKEILFEVKNLKVKMMFSSNPEKKGYDAQISLTEDRSCMLLKLINFNNSMGTGLTKPVEIGTTNGSRLFLQFIVYRLGDSDSRMISYTWLIQKF